MQSERLWIRTRWQIADDAQGGDVDHLDRVVVACAHQDRAAVGGHGNATRTLAYRHRLHGLHLVEIDNADRVVALVRHIGRVHGRRPEWRCQDQAGQHAWRADGCPVHHNLHLVSGRSKPSVSSAVTWCRKPGCGEIDTTARPSDSRIGCRSCRSQSRSDSFCPL